LVDGLLCWVGTLIETVGFFSAGTGVLDVIVVGEVDGGRLLVVLVEGVKLMTLGGDPLRR
jgi:hypothetical protein